ncbi:MAG TPA: hypothetical protein VJ950_03825 [Acidimicrobiia bacterium]|nr:hypothetical protein [Acidimicrobiia bacterium]
MSRSLRLLLVSVVGLVVIADSGEVVDGWVGVVAETMQPAAAGVWVRESL